MEEYEDEELEQEEMKAPVAEPTEEKNELEILVIKLERRVADLEEKMNIVHKNIRVHHKLIASVQDNFKILLEQVDKE